VIVSSAPLRISFSGGGSDYKVHYEIFGGAVFGSAINKRVYVFVNPLNKFSDENIRFTYRITESVDNIDDLQHPVVREVLKYFKVNKRINIGTMSDLPGKTGLGSSSAFTVALVKAISEFVGKPLEKQQICETSYAIERDILGEAGGIQDHLHATYGGLRLYELRSQGISISDDCISADFNNYVRQRMLLIRVGENRNSAEVAQQTIKAMGEAEKLKMIEMSASIARTTFRNFCEMTDHEGKFAAIEEAIQQNWEAKKIFQHFDSEITSKEIMKLKASGGRSFKVCGAGNTGFLLVSFANPISELPNNIGTQSFELTSRGVEAFEY
jgi:D-glycero-alpha-D-manno-heptose-7-phosphate kinase